MLAGEKPDKKDSAISHTDMTDVIFLQAMAVCVKTIIRTKFMRKNNIRAN